MATNSIAISKDVESNKLLAGCRGSFWDGFFFALIFLVAAPNHFTKQTIAFSASQGVPLASIAVSLSGVVAIAAASAFCWATAQNWAPGSSCCS